jgi:hypothetical protein
MPGIDNVLLPIYCVELPSFINVIVPVCVAVLSKLKLFSPKR